MKKSSELRLLILAILQQGGRQSLTRYRIMIKINQAIYLLLPPYSPGACYHELGLLLKENLIKINQNKDIELTEPGRSYLHEQLLVQPLPAQLTPLLVKVLTTMLLNDSNVRASVIKKTQIELIKFSHIPQTSKRFENDQNLALEKWRKELLRLVKAAVLGLVDG